ncbi:protein-tyrosine-phosphatase [Flavobacterium sp. F-380]|uniref:Protein-tyrosine-phosphatase n=1 Tax=Flavobacterium kayseriense TaxID=2764714 RepID=A0ABR7JAN2_9FLAO|nr:protein-tyrosine-phosphatase [Flavobacterium kayseriense]MBC5842555.1 protein-tyrosine-phosphatase [Flavobacterium kayseriense]MBC5849085.1 protein-tyrosine-phosphatase [Flavobacterium kayseriense]MBU0942432.1 protein-tyrosine-phosphatase [Bacteroidota bacterium]
MNSAPTLFHALEQQIKKNSFDTISSDRKLELDSLINYIQEKTNAKQKIRLNFICTHNSRRSHLAQIWAQTAAAYYNISNVTCYSGGTEATALFTAVATTLRNTGFEVTSLSQGNNPVYSIKYSENEHPVIGFSKKYDDRFNPNTEFAAILTCSSADQGCPFIAGAEKRIPLPFEDPKQYDNTPLQTEKYMEKSIEIAATLLYVFSQIK